MYDDSLGVFCPGGVAGSSDGVDTRCRGCAAVGSDGQEDHATNERHVPGDPERVHRGHDPGSVEDGQNEV